ncbi:hypothetical protein [Micromonospora auratinigra]|uniref:Uncharacterized protein n=1 Tax=Micromonospora auratinigra TaxID=261654 RepID=A0A1A9A818_9ACTN|nr:hypothetical protein [Micromonospora auratinigra]SBT52626.1 hypothetical protein GA0070611_5713 [Micromonospora auratinigra]
MSRSRGTKGAARQPVPASAEVSRADAQIPTCAPAGLPATARVLFAVVAGDGTLVRGLGATSATRLATGMYQVVFDQDVTGAGYLGTVGYAHSGGVAPQGTIGVTPRTGIPNAVFVETYAAGGHADRPFHLAVLA